MLCAFVKLFVTREYDKHSFRLIWTGSPPMAEQFNHCFENKFKNKNRPNTGD